jgi:hypothetical protein
LDETDDKLVLTLRSLVVMCAADLLVLFVLNTEEFVLRDEGEVF